MSMFHELMMRKKEEIMYATIKGTLTENDGVFSGFSTTSFLQLQNAFNPNNQHFEIQTKVHFGDNRSGYLFRSSISVPDLAGRYGYIVAILSNKFHINISTNGTSWVENVIGGQHTISTNTDYWVKFGWDGTRYYLDYSTDGINYIRDITYNLSTPIYNGLNITQFGIWSSGSYNSPFTGTIDLNRSYIKLGSTKYNLQAVVGYTIVGSPTITDGVVSGFSSSNYLKIDKDITTDTIEISIPFSFDTKNFNDVFWGVLNTQLSLLAEINNSGVMLFYFRQGFSSGNIYSNYTLSINTNYILNIFLSYDNFSYKIIDEATNIVLKEATIERETKATPYLSSPAFGRSAPNTTIKIKDTTIKANNKLWFNGQQA